MMLLAPPRHGGSSRLGWTATVVAFGAGCGTGAALWCLVQWRRHQKNPPSPEETTSPVLQQQRNEGYLTWRTWFSSTLLFSFFVNKANINNSKKEESWEHQLLLREEQSLQQNHRTENCDYLDYNGTTSVDPRVLRAMMPYLTNCFGNPSSRHHVYGQIAYQAVQRARRQVTQLLGWIDNAEVDDSIHTQGVWFTSCGTEADNLAVHLALQCARIAPKQHSDPTNARQADGIMPFLPRVITSNVEHPAIDACLKVLEQQGQCTVTRVPVQNDGRVKAHDMIEAIQTHLAETVLVTLMMANNETGALQPIQEVAEYCRSVGIWFHTDAAQAAGKVSLHCSDCGEPDLITLVGHKMGAPKGVACLYVSPRIWQPWEEPSSDENAIRESALSRYRKPAHWDQHCGLVMMGGGQEWGHRAGTENVPYVVGFGEAAALAATEWPSRARHMNMLRDRLVQKLIDHLGEDQVLVHGPVDPKHRLPNTLSVGLRHVHSGRLLAELGKVVAASAGAACHATPATIDTDAENHTQVSSVLKAMNIPFEWAKGTLRLSVGPVTTVDQVDRAALSIAQEAKRQRAAAKASFV